MKDAKLYIKAGCNLLFVLPSYKIMLHCRFSLFPDASSADASLLES